MNRGLGRTALALLLISLAIAVPGAAWYVLGSREVDRQSQALVDETLRDARVTASQLSDRIGSRLRSLLETEDRRPFYHYQNLYHDPKGAYEGASVVPSPLAEGPTDPYVLAYFQVSDTGKLSLPTLNEDVQEIGANVQLDLKTQQTIKQQLESVVPASIDVLQQVESQPSQPPQPAQTSSSYVTPEPQSAAVQSAAAPAQQGQQARQSKVEELEPDAWAQNVDANRLYADIRATKGGKAMPRAIQKVDVGNVKILVEPLIWRTLPVAGKPAPVALRRITTPQGIQVQGFVVSLQSVAQSLEGAALPVRFVPASQVTANEVAVPVSDTGWTVAVNAADAIAGIDRQRKLLRLSFLSVFSGGVAAAVVAGLCVVWIVWRTERLAMQRSQFAASAAHELRTPLAGLQLYGEMLADKLGDPAKSSEYARRIASEAARLGRVVANVLGFTRLERGTLHVRPQPGDLVEAVRDSINRHEPTLEAAGVRLELAVADDVPTVNFDRDAVSEIVVNLLDNAEKHTRDATDRTIRIELETVFSRSGAAVVLRVADRGPGVPANVRSRLFRPFQRSTHPDAPAGLGLGLVLVQALARAQGSQVSYADRPGGGAVFSVSFPAAPGVGA